MHKKVMLELSDGSRRWGYATTEHNASSYGQPVITLDDVAYGPADMGDMRIICRDIETVNRLKKARYNPIKRNSLAVKKGIAFPPDLADAIEQKAEERGLNFSQMTVEILKEYFAKK